MLKYIAALIAFVSASAQASPVFLKCDLNTSEGLQTFDVQLNEAANTVTYSFDLNGERRSVNAKAFFASDRVSFNSFTVSRTDLSFQRDHRDSPFLKYSNWNPVDHGKCVVNKQPRAF